MSAPSWATTSASTSWCPTRDPPSTQSAAAERMSNPLPYLVRMLLFLAAVVGLAYLLHHDLLRVFMNTPILNSVIVAVLVIGIFFVMRQVISLWPEVRWLRRFQHREEGAPPLETHSINLLVPLATMVGDRQDHFRLSPTPSRICKSPAATPSRCSPSSRKASKAHSRAWRRPSAPRCSASRDRWCWASWNCRRARPRAAFTSSWRNGWPAPRGSRAAYRSRATRACRPMSRPCSNAPPTASTN